MVKLEDVRVKDEEIGGLLIPRKSSEAIFKVPAPKTSSLGALKDLPSCLLLNPLPSVGQAFISAACRSGCLSKEEASGTGQA